MALVHHELCFGCGRTNLFGLLMEAERHQDGTLTGRCFIKQDHQGPERGRAHPGLVACALIEAMSLLAGDEVSLEQYTLWLEPSGAVTVGAFCEVQAAVQSQHELGVDVQAVALAGGQAIARATGVFGSRPNGNERSRSESARGSGPDAGPESPEGENAR